MQRKNHDVVLEFLNIKNFDVFRMFEMSFSIQLKWFQFVTMKIIIDFEKNINFRESVLTNATNLNKIYIVLTYILWVNFYFIIDFEEFVNVFTKKFNEWQKFITFFNSNFFENSFERLLINVRFNFIVISLIFVNQWCEKIQNVVLHFIVIKYHDIKNDKNDDNFRYDSKLFNKNYFIAKFLNDNVKIVVITSYYTWIIWHKSSI